MVAPATTDVEWPAGAFSGEMEGLTTSQPCSGPSIRKCW